MRQLALCVSILVLLTISIAQDKPTDPTSAPKEQPTAATNNAASNPDQTTTLVFYRPKRYFGSGLTPSVYVNGEEVARLDNGRFFVLNAKPGTLKIESSMKHDPLEMEAKAGKIQYFEMVILAGNWRGGGRLIPTGANDSKEAIKKLKPLDKKWVTSDHVTYTVPDEATASK